MGCRHPHRAPAHRAGHRRRAERAGAELGRFDACDRPRIRKGQDPRHDHGRNPSRRGGRPRRGPHVDRVQRRRRHAGGGEPRRPHAAVRRRIRVRPRPTAGRQRRQRERRELQCRRPPPGHRRARPHRRHLAPRRQPCDRRDARRSREGRHSGGCLTRRPLRAQRRGRRRRSGARPPRTIGAGGAVGAPGRRGVQRRPRRRRQAGRERRHRRRGGCRDLPRSADATQPCFRRRARVGDRLQPRDRCGRHRRGESSGRRSRAARRGVRRLLGPGARPRGGVAHRRARWVSGRLGVEPRRPDARGGERQQRAASLPSGVEIYAGRRQPLTRRRFGDGPRHRA